MKKILGLSGFAGQNILIDLDNKRIIVVNSLYRNYNYTSIPSFNVIIFICKQMAYKYEKAGEERFCELCSQKSI